MELRQLKALHLDYVEKCRGTFKRRAAYARANPSKVLFINIDGMDQYKTGIPVANSKAKDDEDGKPLATKLIGAIAYGFGFYGYWSLPERAASSNLTLTALCRIIRDVSERGTLPNKLQIQMDNTAKDNKNHYLLGFCSMLIAERLFETVEVFFLPVGHTHQDVDQAFSLVSKKLKESGAYTVPHLMRKAMDSWTGEHKHIGSDRKYHHHLKFVLDFRRLLRYAGDNKATRPEDDERRKRIHAFSGLGTGQKNKRYIEFVQVHLILFMHIPGS
jgi:hypothetical protein